MAADNGRRLGLRSTLRNLWANLVTKGIRSLPINLTENDILRSLYTSPWTDTIVGGKTTWRRQKVELRSANDPIPLPPPNLRMGYAADDQKFLSTGEVDAQ